MERSTGVRNAGQHFKQEILADLARRLDVSCRYVDGLRAPIRELHELASRRLVLVDLIRVLERPETSRVGGFATECVNSRLRELWR